MTAKLYGQVLYSLARQERLEGELLRQMQSLNEAFQKTPDFMRLLASCDLSMERRRSLLDECFGGKLHPYLLNFLKILTEEGLIGIFSECCSYAERCYCADQNIEIATAYTAVPLKPEQLCRLKEKLEQITGKTVRIENRIDPNCLGGVRLCYDGKQLDGTVRGHLSAIGKQLKTTVL